jgi:Cys-rich repeat protein
MANYNEMNIHLKGGGQMKRALWTLGSIPIWLFFWTVLAGADGSCMGPATVCDQLTEEACLANQTCQPVYAQTLEDGTNGLRCAPMEGTRCVNPDPVFDHCEDRPTCQGLSEQECLENPRCQAIYGGVVYNGEKDSSGEAPRCFGSDDGTRCIGPDPEFVECVDVNQDPCLNLSEKECLANPLCEAEYAMLDRYCEPSDAGGVSAPCSEPEFSGCHQRSAQCRVDEDCYAYGPMELVAPDCMDFYFTCENGQCVFNCNNAGCKSDADCQQGERCDVYCGNGWCKGQCVPVEQGCASNADCREGEFCEVPPECGVYDENGEQRWDCTGVCKVKEKEECISDVECQLGFICEPDCGPDGFCAGACVQGCRSDRDCPEGALCAAIECFAFPCIAQCVPVQWECGENAACPAGFACENGKCVPVQEGCKADADCPEGQLCEQVMVDCRDPAGTDCFGGTLGVCVRGTWMSFQPMQCVETPWGTDARVNPGLYGMCMINCADGTNCGTGFDEVCVLNTFLANQGIRVHDTRNVLNHEIVCEACGVCPMWNTFYVLAEEKDINALLALGFMWMTPME